MFEQLLEIFKTDLVEVYNYTDEEAEVLSAKYGDKFVNDMITNLWDNWSESFPVSPKEE